MLDQVLAGLPRAGDPNLLVGFDTADDAGVYLLSPELALVQTVDFFSPVVDDPFAFGQIAAANALSDIYAMGARPLTALSIVGFPDSEPPGLLASILAGGLDKLTEAGCTLAGGHSVRDEELKFGFAITGTVHPGSILRNSGARPGDALILTKPLGTGVISTAVKRGAASPESAQAALDSMRRLNRQACEIALRHHPSAITDITGFGLAGHAREMALASNVSLRFSASALPLLPGALDYALEFQPQGLRNNREFAACAVRLEAELSPALEALLYDPQTSGGLLIALPAHEAAPVLEALTASGHAAARIGDAVLRGSHALSISL